MRRLEGKVALVTGGGTGIGAATARRLASEGARIVVTGRRHGPIEEIAAEIGGTAVSGSTVDEAHLAKAVNVAIEGYGGLDILVANAGTAVPGSVEMVGLAAFRDGFEINLHGAMLAARHAIPAMRRRGAGSIVLIASTAALEGFPTLAGYMCSKAALLGLSRSLAIDYGAENIRSNVVCPAYVKSEMVDESFAHLAQQKGCSVDELISRLTRPIPLRRLGSAEEIASAIAFLASDDASFITGSVLVADGGNMIVGAATTTFS
jgi:meso-butanediol dehydrogenase / (S,S)-butanediol dehydrogenase / diacetyl reductase